MRALFSACWAAGKVWVTAKATAALGFVTAKATAAIAWFVGLGLAQQLAVLALVGAVGASIYYRKEIFELLRTADGRKKLLKLALGLGELILDALATPVAIVVKFIKLVVEASEAKASPVPA